MIWGKNKKYTYADYLEWNHAGYGGMEILDGVPYQYGISVFEQKPIRFPPEVLQKILVNFFDQFRKCLKDTPYRVFLSRSIMYRFVKNGIPARIWAAGTRHPGCWQCL